jgi:hypothetical protein
MLNEIIQHQYNVFLKSLFFDVLVGNNLVNVFVKFMGKCWNSNCGLVVVINEMDTYDNDEESVWNHN